MSIPADNVLARELATEATSLHLLDQHDAALQTLQRLEGLLPDDPAVQHNLLVAGWYADTGTTIQSLAQELEACADASLKQEGSESAQTSSTVASINYAALLHMQQQHAKALEILEPLYLRAESMHGGSAVCLCVLLLEIYLGSDQHAKAAQVLHYLQSSRAPEVPLRPVSVDDEVGGDSASGSPTARCTSPSISHPQATAVQQSPSHREPLARVQQEQQREEELQEQEQLRSVPVGLDLPLVSRVTSPAMQQVQLLVCARDGTVCGVDVPALLHLYKARLAMACGNFKAAKKEVRGLTSLYPDNAAGILLKCELEVLRLQSKKALRTLAPLLTAPTDCTTRCKLQLLTLLAAIHHQLGKHHVAALYLSAACEQQQQAYRQQQHGQLELQQHPGSELSQQQQVNRNKQRRTGKKQQQQQPAASLPATSSNVRSRWLIPDHSDALQYSLGLQQLLLVKWQAALQCFEAASSSYYNRCAVWLRLAEANIGLYHEQQQQQQQQAVPPDIHLHHQQRQPQQQQQQQHEQPKGKPAACSATTVTEAGGGVGDQADGSCLLQQAAQQLSTGCSLLQEQQAEAAKQAEAAAAAMSAAAAAVAAAENVFGAGEGRAVSSSLRSPWFQLEVQSSTFCHTGSLGSVGSPDATAAAASPLFVDGGNSSGNTSVALPAASGAGLIAGSVLEACPLPPDLSSVQQALLANQAYVHLVLQQAGPALTAAQALLACSSNSCHYHYLGSCYAAEALLLLGRSDEAVEQLQGHLAQVVDSSSGLWGSAASAAGSLLISGVGIHLANASAAAAKSDSNSAVCQASSLQMQAALLANLASVHAVQGDYDNSRQHAAAAVAADPGITDSPDVLFLALQSVGGASGSGIAGSRSSVSTATGSCK